MNILIIKLGATGDVVRTTPLLRRLTGSINWLTATKNLVLLRDLEPNLRSYSWEQRHEVSGIKYDLVINLEDSEEVGHFVNRLEFEQLFGAYLDGAGQMHYSDDSRGWFDLSLISRFGREAADKLKFENRRTYQELIFGGLGLVFNGEKYLLPAPAEAGLAGDVAIAPEAGPVWPMKRWAYYPRLKRALEARGLVVNLLPLRSSLLEHLADVHNHRCLVGGDSLPMHKALGTDRPCVTLFTCTSPWEIYDYGIQAKIVSPVLGEFFYKRGYDRRATTAIGVEEVLHAVLAQLQAPVPVANHTAGK